MAGPCVIVYKNKEYTREEFAKHLRDGVGIETLVKQLKPRKELKAEESSNFANLTEDKDGNFVFFHRGGKDYETIKKSSGGTLATNRQEAAALGRAGGAAMYYTRPKDSETMVTGESKYAVKVPKDRVYDFNSDPENLIVEAREIFEKENPGIAFSANDQLAQVTRIAGERGYDMVVAEWDGKTRAQTTVEFKPNDVQVQEGDILKKSFEEEYESNTDKGYKPVIPETKDQKLKGVYDAINEERNKQNKYDNLYRLREDYVKKEQSEITKMIEESDISQELKDRYKEAIDYKEGSRRSEKVFGDVSKRVSEIKADTENEFGETFKPDGKVYEVKDKDDIVTLASENVKPEELTTDRMLEFKKKFKAIIDKVKDAKIGVFRLDNGDYSIDLNTVVDAKHRENTVKFAKDNNQVSIYNGKEGEIKTGGTGETTITDQAEIIEAANRIANGEPHEFKKVEVKPAVKSKLEAFKAKHIEPINKAKEGVKTSIENAKKSLTKLLPDVEIVTHENSESFKDVAGKDGRGFYDPATKKIHVNLEKANGRTVAHEVFHALLFDKLKTDKNIQDITKKMIDAVSKSLESNPELKAQIEEFANNYSEVIKSEEKMSELFGHLADGYEGFDTPTKSIVKRFLDRVVVMLGLKPFTEGDVVDMLNTVAGKLAAGEEITKKDVRIIKEKKAIKDAVKKFQADFIDPKSNVEFVYDKNKDNFKELESKGYITKDKSLEDFNGQTIFLHQPDAAFSGEIYKNGERLVEGKGGVYYPIKFHEDGYFWASTESTANKMAKDLNAAREANGGKLLMALTSAPSDKLLSSTTAANGVMDIVLSKAFDKNFSLNKEQTKRSLIDAANKVTEIEGKKVGLGLKLKKGATLEEVKSEIQNKLNPDNSSFADRKAFVKSFISNIADIVKQNPKAVDQFGKFFSEGIKNESFKGVTKTGKLSISAANMTQALSEMLTEPMLKEGIDRDKGGQVYAILELNGEVKPVDSKKHESYPKAIQSVDPNNKVKLHILTDRSKWNEVFEDPETGDIVSKDRELKIFPTSGVSVKGLKLNVKEGKFQETGDYADMKDIVKDLMDDGKSISEIKKIISSELGQEQVSLAERAHNELTKTPEVEFEPKEKVTSIKNEVTEAERAERGLAPVEQFEKYNAEENFNKTKERVESGDISPRSLAKAIVTNPKGVPITHEVSDALAYDRMRLSNEYDKALSKLEKDPTDAAAAIEVERIERDMQENDEAARMSGTISSQALLARKNVIKQDYSLDRIILKYKAKNNGEISPEKRAEFTKLSKEIKEAEAKSEAHDKKVRETVEERVFNNIKKAAAKEGKKTNLKAERENLYAKLREIRFPKGKFQEIEPTELPENMGSILNQLAKNLIMDGVTTLDGVIDEIHANVKDIFEGVTKREIRDQLSGYGKVSEPNKEKVAATLREVKSQGRLVSALEDVESGRAPLKTGFQRGTPSDEVRRLQAKVQELMKQNGITSESLNPEKAWKTALDGIKTRLKNQIKDLERQIATGEKTAKKTGVAYDEEAKALKEQRDVLKASIEAVEGKREISDEQRVKMAVSALEKSIAEYERRISERDTAPKPKGTKTPETDEIKTLKQIRDNVKSEYEQMKEDMNPKKSPEERALATLKTRLKKREAELQEKLDTGNFEKKERRITEPDEEAMKLRANVNKLKSKVDMEIRKQDLANRPKYKKALDFIATLRRTMLLTGIKVLGKLSVAAASRTTISPIEEITGGVLAKIPGLSKIAKQAPREGGFNTKAEVKAISQWWQKATYEDMRDIVKSGKGTLDLLHGKEDIPPSILDFFGQLHQALKQPAKRNEYFRSFEKRMEHASENGVDIMDPVVQATISTQAYLDANRAIFMQDNIATKAYKSFLSSLERGGKVGETAATGLKIILPIVKVPTNYVGEVTSYTGGYAKALPLIGKALFKGVDSLTPEQSDYVMRNLKKGSLGAAMIALGYFNAGAIGGYYQRGEKREEGDVKAGGLKLFGVDMPRWMVHTPLLECLQVGATLKRVQDTYESKGKEEGMTAAGLAVTKGLVEEVPFARSPEEALRALSGPKEAEKYAKDLGESFINPQLTQELGLKIFEEEKKEQKITREMENEIMMNDPEQWKELQDIKRDKRAYDKKLLEEMKRTDPELYREKEKIAARRKALMQKYYPKKSQGSLGGSSSSSSGGSLGGSSKSSGKGGLGV